MVGFMYTLNKHVIESKIKTYGGTLERDGKITPQGEFSLFTRKVISVRFLGCTACFYMRWGINAR